ncbi:MAG TPA: hypothetical protein HA224_00410 [Nanoarchaeota archaeon]|nr:hypothetical protein [Nanoarchaeota archaeon]
MASATANKRVILRKEPGELELALEAMLAKIRMPVIAREWIVRGRSVTILHTSIFDCEQFSQDSQKYKPVGLPYLGEVDVQTYLQLVIADANSGIMIVNADKIKRIE